MITLCVRDTDDNAHGHLGMPEMTAKQYTRTSMTIVRTKRDPRILINDLPTLTALTTLTV